MGLGRARIDMGGGKRGSRCWIMENGKDVRDAGDEKQTRHFLQSEEMAEKVADQNPPVIAQRRVLSSGDVCIIG